MRRFILISFFVFTFFLPKIAARNIIDVDSVGDLWVFAIDKSGSMDERLSPVGIYDTVVSQLKQLRILDRPDYSKDHFCFYNTGIHDGPTFPSGRIILRYDLDVETPFVEIFVRPGSQFNSRFIDSHQLLAALKIEIVSDYPYKYSFVSQIRTCVLADVVTRFRNAGLSADYKNIYVVTITDDGDVNDQWRRDYKEMRHASIKKLDEVNRLNTKYVYNPLNQSGGGLLKEECSSYNPSISRPKPHVWLHSYSTGESQTELVAAQDSIFKIKASDGHAVRYELLSRYLNGDSICFVYIDSITINDASLQVNDYVATNDTMFEFLFDNSLTKNEVQVTGSIQVLYNDSIYGSHFKKYPFVYSEFSYSNMQVTLFSVIVFLLVLALLILLVTLLLIRTNLSLFWMYMPDGKIVRAKRGFKSQWKDGVIPLISVKNGKQFLINHLRNISVCHEKKNASDKILLVSPFKLNFSFDVECYDTSMDIDDNFSFHSDDYNPLLKLLYQSTITHKLFAISRENRKLAKICDAFIYLFNLVCKRYYYLVARNYSDIIVSFESDLLKKKIFLMEFWSVSDFDETHIGKDYISVSVNDILNDFYTKKAKPESEYLVRYEKKINTTIWYVVQLEYEKIKYHSLRNARVVLYYEQKDHNDLGKIIKILVKLTGSARVDVAEWEKPDYPSPYFFNVHLSNCMSFISVVDDTGKNLQQLISPFEDGDSISKFVRLRKSKNDGYLYSSLLPLDRDGVGASVKNRIADNIIRINTSGTVKLDMGRGEISFMGNKIKYQ